jgi:hypothetical protein
VFGSADVYYDLPPFQAPGAIRGSVCTVSPDAEPRPVRAGGRRYPAAYAFDDHGFWLAQAARAVGVPCLVLRSILLGVEGAPHEPPPLFSEVISGRFGRAVLSRPKLLLEIGTVLRNTALCRTHLASALAVLLVLHDRAA